MSINYKILNDGLKLLDDLENGRDLEEISHNFKTNIDLTDLLILEKEFGSPKTKNKNNNVPIVNIFPNALLLEEPVAKDVSDEKKNITEKQSNIWELLDQLKKNNNNSESLDTLTTDSENGAIDDNFDKKKCKGCNSIGLFVEDQQIGAMVCSDCGMINEALLDQGPEWRQYNNEDSRGEGINRCGCPSNAFFPKSSQGSIITGTNNRLKRKQKWNNMVYKERSLNDVFEIISKICSANSIPKIISDVAKALYKKLSDCKHKSGNNVGKQRIFRADNRLSIIAACIHKACIIRNSPRNVSEIAKYFDIREKKITKGIKQFDAITRNYDDYHNNAVEDYIKMHCPKLKINKEDTNTAVKIAYNCCRMKLASDHNPQSLAAGSILVTVKYYDLNIEKKSIAKLFGTSEVTISKIYNKIAPYVDVLVDDEATEYIIEKYKING